MLYSPVRIKRALIENTVNEISKYYTRRKSYDRKVLDRIASDCLYTITLKSDERRARAWKAQTGAFRPVNEEQYDPKPYIDVSFELNEINYIVNVANSLVYGSAWREFSRRDQLPVAGFFIDFDGSRYWKEAPPLRDLKGPHAHGFMGYPESHIDRAQEVLPTLMKTISARSRMLFDKYEISRFDPARVTMELGNRSALENYIGYSAKGVCHLMNDRYRSGANMWSGELYRIYPNPAGGSYGYPRPPVEPPKCKEPF